MARIVRFKDLYEKYQFNRLMKDTEKFIQADFEDNSTVFSAYYHRIITLIYIGNFEDAEIICYKVLDSSKNVELRQHIYRLLSEIFYYQEEYTKTLFYAKKANLNSITSAHLLTKMVSNMYCDFDDATTNRLKIIPKEVLMKHVQKSHRANFSFNLNKFIKCIQDNFHLAKTYHEGYSVVKYFRCNGYLYSDYKGRGTSCQYIKVVAGRDNPYSILTFYPIDNIGDLQAYDISESFYKDIDSWKSESDIQRTKEHSRKFYARQSKRNK